MSLSRRDFWSSIMLRARPRSTALLATPQFLHVIYMWVRICCCCMRFAPITFARMTAAVGDMQ